MLSLLPIFAYLVIVKLLDNFSFVRWQMIAVCGAAGVSACGFAVAIDYMAVLPGELFPVLEEMLKGLIILYLIVKRKVVFFAEALCYGAAVGAGFALLENTLYVFSYPEMSGVVEAFRGFGTALLHMGCTATFAVFAICVNRYLAIIPAALVHYLYNMFLLPESLQIILTIVLFLVFFSIISIYDEKRIYKWLDSSIANDIKLLAAIRKGQLADTSAGRYLCEVKKHFPPEVFFDMICYVQLYIELLVKGKSRLLLQQEGLAEPLSEEEKDRIEEQKKELHSLSESIGFIGRHVLRPILRFDIEDIRII